NRFGDEMLELFEHRHRMACAAGPMAAVSLWCRALWDLVCSVWRERRPGPPRQLVDGAGANIRDAFRFLWRSPGLSLTVSLLAALTIGAATSIFSIVNAVLIRPLPFGDPDRIVSVWEARPERQTDHNQVSGHEFPEWEQRNRAFERM